MSLLHSMMTFFETHFNQNGRAIAISNKTNKKQYCGGGEGEVVQKVAVIVPRPLTD